MTPTLFQKKKKNVFTVTYDHLNQSTSSGRKMRKLNLFFRISCCEPAPNDGSKPATNALRVNLISKIQQPPSGLLGAIHFKIYCNFDSSLALHFWYWLFSVKANPQIQKSFWHNYAADEVVRGSASTLYPSKMFVVENSKVSIHLCIPKFESINPPILVWFVDKFDGTLIFVYLTCLAVQCFLLFL